MGNFYDPNKLIHAAEHIRDAGYEKFDIYTPYPVHGIEKAMGMKRTPLPRFSLGGAFRVFTAGGTEIAVVKGDWKGWNFRFLSGDTELGLVTKQWAGLGKELFTTADNYMISINGTPNVEINTLLLAAGLAIDTVLKERK